VRALVSSSIGIIIRTFGFVVCLCGSFILECHANTITNDGKHRSATEIVEEITLLESQRDPKCYATASRLEDFMFGTPLADEARFEKNILQKKWAKKIWLEASILTKNSAKKRISQLELQQVLNQYFSISQDNKGHWQLHFPDNQVIRINLRDKVQYASIAYSLRAVLGVQQEFLLDVESELLPLDKESLELLTDYLDLFNLAVLKISDNSARKNNQLQISRSVFVNIWHELISVSSKKISDKNSQSHKQLTSNVVDLSFIKKIIRQKISSYQTYNNLSDRIFYRNLQVYFAKMNLSKNIEDQKAFRESFTQSMIQFAFDVYKESERVALSHGHKVIRESDVHQLVQSFIPHNTDEFEDVLFFPKLPRDKQITIESYDADAFRDNSSHWKYLDLAIKSTNLKPKLQPDPFALELMAENIALFGVLSLKVAGVYGKSSGDKYLLKQHYEKGLVSISKKVREHQLIQTSGVKNSEIKSSSNKKKAQKTRKKFSDITEELGLKYMHRSSDWLSRLLRSYLKKAKNTGVIFIPPAFGGSGIAAEDINNDGYTDLLILGGKGNRLYLNQQGDGFKDITRTSGIEWLREKDNQPGEPRQPIIADLNNDGLQDIIITYVDDTHRVYQNIDGTRFKDVSNLANLGGKNMVGGPATVADFNNDGLLDIYVTYFGHYTKGILPKLKRTNNNALPNQLFENIGGFRFKNITSGSGVDNKGWSQAVIHSDFNNDGWQDIIVGNDFGTNAYYQNNGDGTFTDKAAEFGTDKASYSMSIGIADLNQDLTPDIYVSNIVIMNKDEKYVSPNENTVMKFDSEKLSNMRVIEANDLFISDTENSLSYHLSKSVGRGYSSTGWSWDADFFDYDNDGDSDLYVLNGMNEFNLYTSDNPYFTDTSNKQHSVYIPVSSKESNVFFDNDDGKLNNISKGSGIDHLGNSRSAVYLDYDRDGDLDIAINNFHEAAIFYKNNLDTQSNHWLRIKLIGDVSKKVNRDAIGAKLILTTTDGDFIWREIHATTGYMSVHPKKQHFGLGDASIKQLKIVWPNNEIQILRTLEVDREYVIEQTSQKIKGLGE